MLRDTTAHSVHLKQWLSMLICLSLSLEMLSVHFSLLNAKIVKRVIQKKVSHFGVNQKEATLHICIYNGIYFIFLSLPLKKRMGQY